VGQKAAFTLQTADLNMYLAVKRKALSRLEEALQRLEQERGDPLQKLAEISVAEREAAAALGFDPNHFARVSQEVGRLLALKGRHEESFRLQEELKKTREELARQERTTRDRAAKEFLQAQVRVLDRELVRLAEGQELSPQDEEGLQLLAQFRVEIAQLQARQERLQRRIREVWMANRKAPTPTP
jgi:chromosome segregation ATPase